MSKIKKLKIILFFYFFILLLPIEAQEYIIINLGENCSARAALEAVDIKQESYPFDSCIVPFSALIQTLQDDFNHYTNPDYFTPYIDNQSPVNRYGVVLAHNFPLICIGKKASGEDLLIMDPQWREVLPDVQAKFARRIARFRDACHSFKKVCFFRYLGISYSEAKQLSELLTTLYPNLDFVLICVNNSSSSHDPSWNLPRVKCYSYNTTALSALEEWKRIFIAAQLL
jgi:hypothetical protein